MFGMEADAIAIIILAAGNSSRLGRAKQNLLWQGIPLLRHVALAALESALGPVVVVTGAYEAEVAATISDLPLLRIQNADWAAGMASGIVLGVQTVQEIGPSCSSIILAVTDQPAITAAHFRVLAEARFSADPKGIVSSAYAGTQGTPVMFSKKYFSALTHLEGTEGARKLLRLFRTDVAEVSFAGGAFDVDTEEDWEQLKKLAE